MQVVSGPLEARGWSMAARASGRRVGLVPTMGYLHAGHLSLIEASRAVTDVTAVSIFVNPTQFGPNEDLDRYPRSAERDLALCAEQGADLVFLPQARDMYRPDHSVYVVEEMLGRGLCGASRPGHFRGVCTVVAKLFNIIQPHVAVFGQKDAQQVAVIQRMVRDLDFPIEIRVAPIVREADGLAMSSRNVNLSPDERQSGLGLSRALQLAQAAWREGRTDAADVKAAMTALMTDRFGLKVDYVEIVAADTLAPVMRLAPGVLVAVAAFAGRTRLIDNHAIEAQ